MYMYSTLGGANRVRTSVQSQEEVYTAPVGAGGGGDTNIDFVNNTYDLPHGTHGSGFAAAPFTGVQYAVPLNPGAGTGATEDHADVRSVPTGIASGGGGGDVDDEVHDNGSEVGPHGSERAPQPYGRRLPPSHEVAITDADC
jgi:hypothetical protein